MSLLAFSMEFLHAVDIAKLLMVSRCLDDNVELIIKSIISERHGQSATGQRYSLVHQLAFLENFPVRSKHRFNRRGIVKVISGNRFSSIRMFFLVMSISYLQIGRIWNPLYK